MTSPRSLARRFGAARDGVSAVEFACILPLFLMVVIGGSEYARALAISRKVTLTTRTVADLATRVSVASESDITVILKAATAVMAPYDTANIKIVLSEVTTSQDGNATTVTWSRTLNGTALTAGSSFPLASGAVQAGASLVVSQVSYAYAPVFGGSYMSSLTLSDMLYMSPRLSAQVTISGS